MEIIVNKEKIDFTLQDEKSLGEIIDGVESWVNSSKLIITSLKCDNKELLDKPEAEWQGLPLDNIKKIDITAELLEELKFNNLNTVCEYIDIFTKGLKEGDKTKLDQIQKGKKYLFESLKTIYSNNPPAALSKGLAEIAQLLSGSTTDEILKWPAGIISKTVKNLESVQLNLLERIEEFNNPYQSLANIHHKLQESAAAITEVSMLLQSGQDQKAMECIIDFSELSEKLMRCISYLKNLNQVQIDELVVQDKPFEDFIREMNLILNELISAFNHKDSILIGDLLEYEIAPRLESLIPFVKRLEEK